MSNDTENNAPVWRQRDGNIEATTWQNQGRKGVFFSTEFRRSYKDGEDNWQRVDTFSGTDLLKVSQLAQMAYQAEQSLRLGQSTQRDPSIDAAKAELRSRNTDQQQEKNAIER